MTRRALWKQLNPRVPRLLVFGVLAAMMSLGCAQSPEEGGGDQTSEGQTATTQGDTTAQATIQATTQEATTSSQENASQQNNSQREGGVRQTESTMQQQQNQQDQQSRQTITVRVTGTEGLPFSGRVGSVQGMRRVEGSVPEEYEIAFGVQQ